jgi:hypothetical protein
MAYEDNSIVKESGRRRVFLFIALWIVVALSYTLIEESDEILHAVDEYVIWTLSLILIIYFIVNWKKKSPSDLHKQNTFATVLFAIALVFKIIAIPLEIADPPDFGNEIPVLILMIFMMINRFT